MNFRKKGIWAIAAFTVGVVMISCGGATSQKADGKDAKESEKIVVPTSYEGTPVIQAYLHLKDALVLSDQKSVSSYAKQLVASFDPQMNNEKVTPLREDAMAILKAKDLEKQREIFKELSNKMMGYIAENDPGINLYVQHCPMAFSNAGGDWLSAEEEIFNPYYGDKMLHCGIVKDEIQVK